MCASPLIRPGLPADNQDRYLAVWAAPDPNSPGKRIEWDAKTLTPTNAPELSAIVTPQYREGYVL